MKQSEGLYKRLVSAFVVFTLLAVVFAPSMVVAQTNADGTEQATDAASAEANRSARIEKYRQRVTDVLTSAEQRRLANLCTAAQTVANRLQGNLETVIENRQNAYDNAVDLLNGLVEKLQAATVDTTGLEAAIIEMDMQADNIIEIAMTYQTALSDLAEMDCVADPAGFKAALTVLREQRVEVIANTQVVRDYFVNTIKPLLQALREQLNTSDN